MVKMRPPISLLVFAIIVIASASTLVVWNHLQGGQGGGGPGISAPPGFTQTGQSTHGGYTYTSYTGTSAVQDALNTFKTQMQGEGWVHKTERWSVDEYIGDLYEKGEWGAVVSAAQAGEGQVTVTVIIGAKSEIEALPEISLVGLTPDKENYGSGELAEFTVNLSSSKAFENITVRLWGIKSLQGDYFYQEENRAENLAMGMNDVRFTWGMPDCSSCFRNDYGEGPYEIYAGVYVQNEMVDNGTITMSYDEVHEVFVFAG